MADDPTTFLQERARSTEERLDRLRERLKHAEALVGDHATVYATGSFARGEASANSDLDVFIITDTITEGDTRRPLLGGIATTKLQAALIEAAEGEGLPQFSDGGRFLEPHWLSDLTEKLGGPEDDYENLFTARMLLILESRALLGEITYERAITQVFDEYWRDYEQNTATFLPIYLTNDLIRYWKVLCLNYEANTRNTEHPNKRRLNNYKLKHSRLLTCYSALLYFCHLLRGERHSITKADAREMSRLSPTQRLRAIGEEADHRGLVEDMLGQYVEFLESTDAPKADLQARFDDAAYRQTRRESGQNFGDLIFRLLEDVGRDTKLFRYLVV